jgi:hypothetical protein
MPSRRGLVSQFLRQCIDTWLGGIILLCDKPRRRCCALGPLGARSGVRVPNAPTCPITRESWKCRRGYPVWALWRSSPTSFRRAAQSPTSFAFQRASYRYFLLTLPAFRLGNRTARRSKVGATLCLPCRRAYLLYCLLACFGTSVPKRPSLSSSGPAVKNRMLVGPAGPPLPNLRPHRPSISTG